MRFLFSAFRSGTLDGMVQASLRRPFRKQPESEKTHSDPFNPTMQIRPRIFLISALPLLLTACGGFGEGLASWVSTEEEDPRLEILREHEPLLKLKKQWSASAGGGSKEGHVRLRLLLQGNTVFACSGDGAVSAFSAQSGKRFWRRHYGGETSFCPGGGDGVLALGTAEGEVIALSAEDGGELWRRGLSRREVTAVSRRHQNTILIRTADNGLFALDADSGRLLWSADYALPVLVLRGMSVPLFYGDYAVLGLDDGRLLTVRLHDGVLEREIRVGLAGMGSDLEKIVDIDGRLQIENGVVYAAAYQGRTAAYDLEASRLLWLSPHGSYAGVTADDRFVYMTDSGGSLRAIDRYTGADVWSSDLLGVFESSAALAYRDFLVLGDSDGRLNWLSADDGSLLTREKVRGKPIAAAPVLWRNLVIVLDRGGHLAAYRAVSRRVVKSSERRN